MISIKVKKIDNVKFVRKSFIGTKNTSNLESKTLLICYVPISYVFDFQLDRFTHAMTDKNTNDYFHWLIKF